MIYYFIWNVLTSYKTISHDINIYAGDVITTVVLSSWKRNTNDNLVNVSCVLMHLFKIMYITS